MDPTSMSIMVIMALGVVLIYIAYTNSNKICPPPTVVVKHIPRTFEEEQRDPVKPSEIFKGMFEDDVIQ